MKLFQQFIRKISSNNWKPLKKVGVIGVPFEKGQKKYGVSVAPAAMRAAGLIEELKEIGNLFNIELDVNTYLFLDL